MAITIKEKLYNHCKSLLEVQMKELETAIDEAQDSANSEEKSSAGDKYETSRAMGQINRDMHAKQLAEVIKNSLELKRIGYVNPTLEVLPGSLVHTSEGMFYILVGLGKVIFENKTYIVLSTRSPIGNLLLHQKVGSKISFQNKQLEIKEIC